MGRHAMVLCLVLSATGCDGVFGLEPVQPRNADYAFRKRVSFTSPATTTLTNFPVAIIIKNDHELDGLVGDDLAIRTADGRDVAFELEDADPTSSSGADVAAWVRLDALAPGETVELYLHYGDLVGAPPMHDPRMIWAEAYGAVWHFDHESAGEFVDSTRFHNRLRQPNDAQMPSSTSGAVAEGRHFTGPDDTLEVAQHSSIDPGVGSFTYSIWVRVTAAEQVGQWEMPLYKGGASGLVAGYDFELGTGPWTAQISDGDTANGTEDRLSFESTGLLDTWVQLTAVVDREQLELRLYVNGERRATTTLEEGSLTTARPLVISSLDVSGTTGLPENKYPGRVDELRLYHGVLSEDWIRTEFENLGRPSSFLTIGPAEPLR